MAQPFQGSFRLFQLAGIHVYLHWSWLLVAFVELNLRNRYQNQLWNVLEYLSIFAIVLLHEFGHAFACRSVGGLANRIVLWPLGGVAFVNPPPRPGAVLWSIAAGPLVNVVLVLPTAAVLLLVRFLGLDADVQLFATSVCFINLGLLIFNMLPIYPLDGGQILQSLLWFAVGRTWSLLIASVIGLIVGAAVIVPLLLRQMWLPSVVALFIAMRSWSGIQQARMLGRLDKLPRHEGLACPFCHAAPIQAEISRCPQCGAVFDVFHWQGVCPGCQARASEVVCLNCGRPQPLAAWSRLRQV